MVNGKTYLVTGVANKKSVAYFVAKQLIDQGAKVILSVQNDEIAQKVKSLFPAEHTLICDLASSSSIKSLSDQIQSLELRLDGILHSVAFANFTPENATFHQVNWDDFSNAIRISAFSFVELSQAMLNCLNEHSSLVTISISDTKATSYGYLGPIKELLNSCVGHLAKSLAPHKIRVNVVGAGPLKTSASAGIPNYINNYLYAQHMTLWHQGIKTEEVASSVLFLLGSGSSGINGSIIQVDAGMSLNHFDQDFVVKFNA